MVVQSLILSVLNYCLRVWGSTNKSQMGRVKKLQNFAARVAIGGARKYDHVTPLFNKLGWLRLDKKYKFDLCILMFKIINKILPEHLFAMPTVDQMRNNNVNTRNQNSLYVPRTQTDTGARTLNVAGPKQWNLLPMQIRYCQNISTFKSLLKKHFLE